MKNFELSVIINEKVFIMTQRFSFICRIKAREYSAYERRDQTHSFYDKLIHQLYWKKKKRIINVYWIKMKKHTIQLNIKDHENANDWGR